MSLQCLYVLKDSEAKCRGQTHHSIQSYRVRKSKFPLTQQNVKSSEVEYHVHHHSNPTTEIPFCIMATIINPYSHVATQLRTEQLHLIGESAQFAATMGIQSQRREGAIKKCKKRATKAKHKLVKYAINAGVAFNPIKNCGICKAKHLNLRGIKT